MSVKYLNTSTILNNNNSYISYNDDIPYTIDEDIDDEINTMGITFTGNMNDFIYDEKELISKQQQQFIVGCNTVNSGNMNSTIFESFSSNDIVNTLTSVQLPTKETLDQMLARLEHDIEHDKTSSDEIRKAKAREVSRLRREKKQKEAETITKEIADLISDYEICQQACDQSLNFLEKMIMKEQLEIISGVAQDFEKSASSMCLVCGDKFRKDSALSAHLIENHSIIPPKSLLDVDEDISTNTECVSSGNGRKDKKRKRLEKNALSARLSRQRKKLYILLIQTQLPVVRARLNRLKACMPLKATHLADELRSANEQNNFPLGELFPYEDVSQLLQMLGKNRKVFDFRNNKAKSVSGVSTPTKDANEEEYDDDDDIESRNSDSTFHPRNENRLKKRARPSYRASILTHASNDEDSSSVSN